MPVLRSQRQARQRPDRPVRAQHRIGQLKQRITASRQAGTETRPEPRRTARDSTSAACSSELFITAFVMIMGPLARTHDHAEAALTPRHARQTGKTPDQESLRLSNKLHARLPQSASRHLRKDVVGPDSRR